MDSRMRLYGELPAPADWLTQLCQPPFRPAWQAARAWEILLPHLHLESLPLASALDLEKAWARSSQQASLSRGLELLAESCSTHVDNWFRLAPLRFVKLARMLGSLAPERRRWALEQAGLHPFFDPAKLQLPSQNLGQACLDTWSPLPPPSLVVDAVGCELSHQQENQLRLAVARWIPLAQLEILRHYCGAKAARRRPAPA